MAPHRSRSGTLDTPLAATQARLMTEAEDEKLFNECGWRYLFRLSPMRQAAMEALEFNVDVDNAKEWRCFAYWYNRLREDGSRNFDGVPFSSHPLAAELRWHLRLRQLAKRRAEQD